MGIQITGSNDTIQAADGNLSIEGVSLNFNHENVTGISTMATGHITGTATIDDDLKVGISTLFVDKSTGRIGIGTISPSDLLTIVHSANSDDGISIVNKNNSQGSAIAQLELSGGDNAHARVQFECNGVYSTIRHDGSGNLGFYTNGSNERLRIESDGDFRLTYGDAGTNYGGIRGWNTTTGDMIIDADKSSTGTGDKSNLIFKTRGSERMRLTNNGDVNITGVTTAKSFVPTEGQLANRNVLINGNMIVAQRGDGSYGSLGASSTNYVLDRWVLYVQNSAARFTVSQDSESPDGFGKSIKIDCTTADTSLAATDEVQFFQKVEGFNTQRFNKGTSSALQYTLSFWVKTNKTGTYIVRLLGRDNTNRSVSASYTVSDSNWNKYVLTFPADTTAEDNANNGESLRVVWWLVAGSGVDNGTLQTTWTNSTDTGAATGQVNFADSTSNDFYLTGTQMEVGSVATPFEHRNYADELLRCQRYYQELPTSGDHVMWGFGRAESNSARVQIPLSVPLRASPSITASNFRTCKYDGTMLQSTTTPTVYKWAADFASIILDFPSGGTLTHNNVYIVTSDGGSTGLQMNSEL